MKQHTIATIAWIFIILQFVALEVFALTNRADDVQPFTWYIRKLIGTWTSPLWFLALGFMVWMIVHFLFVHK